jgi:hypothetical protein
MSTPSQAQVIAIRKRHQWIERLIHTLDTPPTREELLAAHADRATLLALLEAARQQALRAKRAAL